MAISRILVAVDLERNTDIVIGAALRLADKFSARLTLIHVAEALPAFTPAPGSFSAVTDGSIARYRTVALDKLKEIVAGFDPKVEFRTIVSEGHPVDLILDAVDGKAHDLIVMGTHGRRGVKHLLLGSKAARVVRESPVPVFTVNTRDPAYRNLALTRLILATDFSPNAAAAESWALDIARAYAADLVVVHVVEESFHPYLPYHVAGLDVAVPFETVFSGAVERYRQLLNQTVTRLAASGVPCRGHLVGDATSVADGLLRAAREEEARLLVLGTHGRAGIDRALLGSVAERMVRLSPTAVLTVRSADTQPSR